MKEYGMEYGGRRMKHAVQSLALECGVRHRGMENGVWNMGYGTWNIEYEARNMEYGLWSMECDVCRIAYGVEFGVWSMDFEAWSTEDAVRSMEYLPRSREYRVRKTGYGIWTMAFGILNMESKRWSAECGMDSAGDCCSKISR